MKRTLVGLLVAVMVLFALSVKVEAETDWSGDAGLGISLMRGNTDTTNLNMMFDVQLKISENKELSFNGDYTYSLVKDDKIMNKGVGLLRYSYYRSPKLTIFGDILMYSNELINLDMRAMPGMGVSYTLVDNDAYELDALVSINAVMEYFAEDFVVMQKYGRWPWNQKIWWEKRNKVRRNEYMAFRFGNRLKAKLGPRAVLEQSFDVYPSFEDFKDYLIHAKIAVTVRMSDHWGIRTAVTSQYDSKPHNKALWKYDVSSVTSIVYSF